MPIIIILVIALVDEFVNVPATSNWLFMLPALPARARLLFEKTDSEPLLPAPRRTMELAPKTVVFVT